MKNLLLSLLVAVGLIGSASAQVPSGDLANGLVGYYPLNGDFKNYGGESYDLTNVGTPTIPLYFNQSFYLTTSDFFPITGNQPRTISLWVKSSVSGGQLLYWGGKDINQHGSELCGMTLFASPNNTAQLCLQGDVPDVVSQSFTLNPNNWSMLTITYANNIYDSNTKLYLDGNVLPIAFYNSDKDGQFPTSLNTPSTTYLTVGIDTANPINPADGWMNPYNGLMKNICVYNTALSSSQVSQLYTLQSAPEPSTYALFGLGAIGLLMVLRRKKTA